MVNPVTCIFHFFDILIDALEVQFFRASFLSNTLIACRAMQLRFILKWKHC